MNVVLIKDTLTRWHKFCIYFLPCDAL